MVQRLQNYKTDAFLFRTQGIALTTNKGLVRIETTGEKVEQQQGRIKRKKKKISLVEEGEAEGRVVCAEAKKKEVAS